MLATAGIALLVALRSDGGLTPVLAEAVPTPARTPARPWASPTIGPWAKRTLTAAALLVCGAVAVVGAVSAITAIAFDSATAASRAQAGPPAELRAGSDAAGNWERSYAAAVPSAGDIGAALYAGAQEQYGLAVLQALKQIDDQRIANAATVRAAGVPRSLNSASGYAAGTVLSARITIYGCVGPGGGFCNNMASGMAVFEGAAACSGDLPFGTKLQIIGDPTGRTYECLDRGALPATWVDVYFHNTSDGMAWQGLLGGTRADIIIVN